MRLKLLFAVFLFAALRAMSVDGRHLKKNDKRRANQEVRSIISAIVDAILDGDRKKRSEVVDFTDDDKDLSPSGFSDAKVKQKREFTKDNEGQTQNIKQKTFTKREEKDEDGSLQMANVMATSDVNSTDDESESLKRDIMQPIGNSTKVVFPEDSGNEPDSGTKANVTHENQSSKPGSGLTESVSNLVDEEERSRSRLPQTEDQSEEDASGSGTTEDSESYDSTNSDKLEVSGSGTLDNLQSSNFVPSNGSLGNAKNGHSRPLHYLSNMNSTNKYTPVHKKSKIVAETSNDSEASDSVSNDGSQESEPEAESEMPYNSESSGSMNDDRPGRESGESDTLNSKNKDGSRHFESGTGSGMSDYSDSSDSMNDNDSDGQSSGIGNEASNYSETSDSADTDRMDEYGSGTSGYSESPTVINKSRPKEWGIGSGNGVPNYSASFDSTSNDGLKEAESAKGYEPKNYSATLDEANKNRPEENRQPPFKFRIGRPLQISDVTIPENKSGDNFTQKSDDDSQKAPEGSHSGHAKNIDDDDYNDDDEYDDDDDDDDDANDEMGSGENTSHNPLNKNNVKVSDKNDMNYSGRSSQDQKMVLQVNSYTNNSEPLQPEHNLQSEYNETTLFTGNQNLNTIRNSSKQVPWLNDVSDKQQDNTSITNDISQNSFNDNQKQVALQTAKFLKELGNTGPHANDTAATQQNKGERVNYNENNEPVSVEETNNSQNFSPGSYNQGNSNNKDLEENKLEENSNQVNDQVFMSPAENEDTPTLSENNSPGSEENADETDDQFSLHLTANGNKQTEGNNEILENSQDLVEYTSTNDGNQESEPEHLGHYQPNDNQQQPGGSPGLDTVTPAVDYNTEDDLTDFEKQLARNAESVGNSANLPITGSDTSIRANEVTSDGESMEITAPNNKIERNYGYFYPSNAQYASNYDYSNRNPYPYEDRSERDDRKATLTKRHVVPKVIEYIQERPVVSEFVQNNFNRMPGKPYNSYRASVPMNTRKNSRTHVQESPEASHRKLSSNQEKFSANNNLWRRKSEMPENPNRPQPIKDDPLESLVSDVEEPWIKNFLVKTLEMAVNGDKKLTTSKPDEGSDFELNLTPAATQRSSAKTSNDDKDDDDDNDDQLENSDTKDKQLYKKDEQNDEKDMVENDEKDDMPIDATKANDRNDDHLSEYEDDDSIDSSNDKQLTIKKITSEAAQARKLADESSEDKSNINLAGVSLSEALKHTPKPIVLAPLPRNVQGSVTVPVVAKTPATTAAAGQPPPPTPPSPPPSPPLLQASPPTSPQKVQAPAPKQQQGAPLVANNQATAAPPVPLVKIITDPEIKVPSQAGDAPSEQNPQPPAAEAVGSTNERKSSDTLHQGILAELNKIMDNGIQNDGTEKPNDELDNTVKEAQLLHVLKEAIPASNRKQNDIDKDLKQELEDLKDYASALADTSDLSPTQHDDLAKNLARDSLDEMKVSDTNREQLLGELIAFVTAMEVAAVRERLEEIRSQVLAFASTQSNDPKKIREEVTRLLKKFLNHLPLPKSQIREKEKKLPQSALLNKLVEEGERRSLRKKLKKALVDLVADKLV